MLAPRHIMIKVSKLKENFEISRRKATCHMQGNTQKTISEFLTRNHTGRKEMGWERKEKKRKQTQ